MNTKSKQVAKNRGMRIQMQQQRSRIENELYRTIVRFAKACNAYEPFMELPPDEHRYIKRIQFRSVHLRGEKGSEISKGTEKK